jgi:hypothetical protein
VADLKRAKLRRKWSTIPKATENLSKGRLGVGAVISAIDSNGPNNLDCGDGERFIVHADEKLTAFV